MNDVLSCILRPNILTYFLSVDASSLCIDVYLIILSDDIKEVLEVGSHLHHDQILTIRQSLKRTIDLRYNVVF